MTTKIDVAKRLADRKVEDYKKANVVLPPCNFSFRTKPYKHQKKGFLLTRDQPIFALTMDMGTGKTKVIIDNICYLFIKGKINGAIIVAPASMYFQWSLEQWPEHALESVMSRTNIILWDAAKAPSMLKYDFRGHQDRLDLLVMNVESFSAHKRHRASGTMMAMRFLKYRKAMFVVDESTIIKSTTASRTKVICNLGHLAPYRRILTGTPVTNSPLDLYGQFSFLDQSILGRSFVAFRAKYAVLEDRYGAGGRSFKTVVGYQCLDDLKKTIDPYTYRVTKEECIDLPEKVYLKYEVKLGKEQQKIYEQMRDQMIVDLGNEEFITAQLVITKIIKLRQILCGHVLTDDGSVHAVLDSNRDDVLLHVLEEMNGKTVIWSTFIESVEHIVQRLSKQYGQKSIIKFAGRETLSPTDRHRMVDEFNNNSKVQFFVSTQMKGKFGLNLVGGNNMIYYNNDYSLDVRLQSQDRINRIGQIAKKITYVDLYVPGTVEEKIFKILRERKDILDFINGDNWKEWI